MKTATLIKSAVCCGAIAAKIKNKSLLKLKSYGMKIGLAFQLKDDTMDEPRLAKKKTILKAKKLISQAKNDLKPFGKKAALLKEIADYVINRAY